MIVNVNDAKGEVNITITTSEGATLEKGFCWHFGGWRACLPLHTGVSLTSPKTSHSVSLLLLLVFCSFVILILEHTCSNC